MSYINEKLGDIDKKKVKDFLLDEGFEVRRENYPHELTYYTRGDEIIASITVDLNEKTFQCYLEYDWRGSTFFDATVVYNYENFEETYKNFIDDISNRLR